MHAAGFGGREEGRAVMNIAYRSRHVLLRDSRKVRKEVVTQDGVLVNWRESDTITWAKCYSRREHKKGGKGGGLGVQGKHGWAEVVLCKG